MRRILTFNHVSVDGYFAAPDGSLDWVVPDPELDKSSATAIERAETDTILFGRRSFLHELDPGQIEALKKQPGKDIIIFGSGTVVSQLSERGLIDEYQFVVCPVLLGGGRPLLGGMSRRLKLDLQGAKRNPSGNVVLRYACEAGVA